MERNGDYYIQTFAAGSLVPAEVHAVYEDEKQHNTMQNDYTLDEWFDIWINVYKVNCRDTSIITYKTHYNSIRDKLGWVRLSRLNRATIQKALNELQTDAMRQNAKARLVDMLNCAAKDELIPKNYAADVVLKRESEGLKGLRRIVSGIPLLRDASRAV